MLRICAFAPPPPGPVENEGFSSQLPGFPLYPRERSGIEPENYHNAL